MLANETLDAPAKSGAGITVTRTKTCIMSKRTIRVLVWTLVVVPVVLVGLALLACLLVPGLGFVIFLFVMTVVANWTSLETSLVGHLVILLITILAVIGFMIYRSGKNSQPGEEG